MVTVLLANARPLALDIRARFIPVVHEERNVAPIINVPRLVLESHALVMITVVASNAQVEKLAAQMEHVQCLVPGCRAVIENAGPT